MIRLDSMLMIGSAESNVGKTELACAIIRKFACDRDIIAVKVTTIKARDGQCPRGGRGCGVCSSLEGEFLITEETGKEPPVKLGAKCLAPQFIAGFTTSQKDTARLLSAGAKRVFWLRVMKSHLKDGLCALLDTIGAGAVTICESNSLRQVVEPGLFLMVKDHRTHRWKDSAQQVKDYADCFVLNRWQRDKGTKGQRHKRTKLFNSSVPLCLCASAGNKFEPDIDRIKLIDDKWILHEQATAVVLAGGLSSRMGTDKRMLPVGSRPMIEHVCCRLRDTFNQVLVSGNDAGNLSFLGLAVVPDKTPGQGPLMAIASALEASDNELNFVVACDIPQIDLSFIRGMLREAADVDVVVPTTRRGRESDFEPLFAVYHKSVLHAINQTLLSGSRKISDIFARCSVKYLKLPEVLANINTMADYEQFVAQFKVPGEHLGLDDVSNLKRVYAR